MFLSSSTRAQLSSLWNAFCCDGMAPQMAIEQLSYLLALKLLDIDASTASLAPLPPAGHWSALKATADEGLLSAAGEAMALLRTCDLSESQLFHAATVRFSKHSLLREVMELIDQLFSSAQPSEMRAHCYEALLDIAEEAAVAWAAPGGKFYTPHHLAHLLCALVRPQPGERICDFACGNGRLLAGAYMHLTRSWCDPDRLCYAPDGRPLPLEDQPWSSGQRALLDQTQLVGLDIDSSAVLQAWMLLRCLGIEKPAVYAIDSLSSQMQRTWLGTETGQGQFDVLLGNPPYASAIDAADLATDLRTLGTTRAEVLFLKLALRLLRPGGRAAIILPDNLLFRRDKATVALRQALVLDHCLHAIISLPKGIFAPYTNVKTSILVLTHSGETRNIWCYTVEADGYSLDKHRRPTPEQNDLPDLLVKYSLRFAENLAHCRPSAFIDADTALQWENIEPERQAYYYAQPLVVQRQFAPGGQRHDLLCFSKTLAVPVTGPKAWEARVDQLAHPLILLPGWYQPTGGLPALATSQGPGYPPGYPFASAVSGTGGTSPARIPPAEANTYQGNGEQDELTLYYLPDVRDLASLDAWYAGALQKMHQLRVQEDLTTERLLNLLRLLHAMYRRQYAAYQANPPEKGETPLTPVDVKDSAGILPWFRGAIQTLQKRIAQGYLSQQQFQGYLLVLAAVKEQLERQYGRVRYSPLPVYTSNRFPR